MKQIVYECQNVNNQQLNNYTANKILGKPTIVKTMQTLVYSKFETAQEHQITINLKLRQELQSISNVHKAKKAANRTNNLKAKANLKQGYHGN